MGQVTGLNRICFQTVCDICSLLILVKVTSPQSADTREPIRHRSLQRFTKQKPRLCLPSPETSCTGKDNFKVISVYLCISLGWRDDSGIKITRCSSRAPGFNFQHPLGRAQLSVTLAPVYMTPPSGLYGHCLYMVHRYICRWNTQAHKSFKKNQSCPFILYSDERFHPWNFCLLQFGVVKNCIGSRLWVSSKGIYTWIF